MSGFPSGSIFGRHYYAFTATPTGSTPVVAVLWWNTDTRTVHLRDMATGTDLSIIGGGAVDPAVISQTITQVVQQAVADGLITAGLGTEEVTTLISNAVVPLQASVSDVETALSGKAALTHTHAIGDVTGLQEALANAGGLTLEQVAAAIDDALESLDFAATDHTHDDYQPKAEALPYVDDIADLPDDAPVGAAFVVGADRVLYVVPDGGTAPMNGATKDAITATDVMRMIADNDATVEERIEALKAMVNGLKMSQFALQAYVLHGDGKQAYNDWTALTVNGTPYSISPPQFRVRHGFLEVRGTLAIGKTTGNVHVASIPADCPKPVMEQSFAVACRESGVAGRSGYVTVGAGGNFNFQAANANAVNEVSFNGIRVEVKQNA